MQINKFVASSDRFLKADVEVEKGSDREFIIERVSEEDLENMGHKEVKPCLWFRGEEKGLVLNKTNAKMLIDNYGSDETNDWLGRKVKLFRTMTSSPSGMVPCIRVRPFDGDATVEAEPADAVDDKNTLQEGDDIPF